MVPCRCMNVVGTLCGLRRKEDLLRGNCQDLNIYNCPTANQPAIDRGKCPTGDCIIGSTDGYDYCPGSVPPGNI